MIFKKGIVPIAMVLAAAVLVAVAAAVLVFGQESQTRPFTTSCIDSARSAPTPKDGPTISSLQPNSGPGGTTVTIAGNKFVGDAKNTVCFGAQNLGQFKSSGDKINFSVPDVTINRIFSTAGYNVYVVNPKGTSNSQVFNMLAPTPTPLPTPIGDGPDLKISKFVVNTNTLRQPISALVEVTNIGFGPTGSFQFSASPTDILPTVTCQPFGLSIPVNGLNPGASFSLSVNVDFPLEPGEYTAYAMADSACQVSETDEGNNSASAPYVIP